jgi:adenylosuccinate lyase
MIERYSLPRMASIWEDENKFRIMLEIELLVAEAQSKLGMVPQAAVARMRKRARFSVKQIEKIEEKTQHDIVAFVTNVASSIGADARYLHMGLTSSDLLDTTLDVQLAQASDIIIEDVKRLMAALKRQAGKYKDTVCIGRTHGVHAEPLTFGLKMALWLDEAERNLARMEQVKRGVSFGKLSGAVGTYSNIDPRVEAYVCRKLGLRPVRVATQVIQRDVYAEYLSVLAVLAASLEQCALEIRHLQRTEVLEAEEPFGKGQKGSSAMPHKRNPVVCERICGLSRVIRANAMAALENVALWHERDISHSSVERVILPDSTVLLDYMLNKMIWVIDGLQVYPQNMMANLLKTKGLIFSQRVLIELMNRGLSRPKAYDYVQRCAMKTWRDGTSFQDNLAQDPDVSRVLSAGDLKSIFDLNYYLRHVKSIFKRFGI